MALGDLVVFNVAKAQMIEGDWSSTDNFNLALTDNTTTPTPGQTTPALTDFTEVTPGGNYSAGGILLDTLVNLVSEAAGVMTFDSTVNPSWLQNAANPTNAYWGIVFNNTNANKDAIAYIDLGGPIDLTAGDLTVTWNASGLFTIT